MPSVLMADSKHRFKVMKLQSETVMGKLSCATLVNLQSHAFTFPSHF